VPRHQQAAEGAKKRPIQHKIAVRGARAGWARKICFCWPG
jgi:hypothetical protein